MEPENLFGQAVANNETDSFFKGKGKYFVRDPDWGVHVYAAHLTGWASNYIEASKENAAIFDGELLRFIASAEANTIDLAHVLQILSAYFSTKKMGLIVESRLFDDEGPGKQAIFRYLNKLKTLNSFDANKDTILLHAKFISNKGFGFLHEFVQKS